MLLLSRCEFCVHVGYAAQKGVSYTHHGDESFVLDVGARCRDPVDSLRRRNGRGSGRRERSSVPHDVQHRMNCELTNFN